MAHEVEILFGLQNEWHASETNLMFQEVCIYIYHKRFTIDMYWECTKCSKYQKHVETDFILDRIELQLSTF